MPSRVRAIEYDRCERDRKFRTLRPASLDVCYPRVGVKEICSPRSEAVATYYLLWCFCNTNATIENLRGGSLRRILSNQVHASLGHRQTVASQFRRGNHRLAQGRDVAKRIRIPRDAFTKQFRYAPADVAHDDRTAVAERFVDHQAPRLPVAGQNHCGASNEQPPYVFGGLRS